MGSSTVFVAPGSTRNTVSYSVISISFIHPVKMGRATDAVECIARCRSTRPFKHKFCELCITSTPIKKLIGSFNAYTVNGKKLFKGLDFMLKV